MFNPLSATGSTNAAEQPRGLPHFRRSSHGEAQGSPNPISATFRRLVQGRLALDDIWLLLPLLVIPAVLNAAVIYPNDFWWHLRTGEIIFQTRAIPTVDLFTFSRTGLPWTNQSWLVQLVFYLLYRVGDLPLIIFTSAITITMGYAFLESACYLAGGHHVRAAALGTMAAGVVGAAYWSIRPQFASFALFGALVYVLEVHRHHGGAIIWTLPPLFALWVNAHGGFVFGAGLLAIYCASQVIEDIAQHRSLRAGTRALLVTSVASACALGLNPSGPVGIVEYVLGFFRSSATVNANLEFQPINIRSMDGALLIAATLVFLIVVYRRRATLSACTITALLLFGLCALYSRRVTPWYGMILGPALAGVLGTWPESPHVGTTARRRDLPALNYLLVGSLLLVVLATVPWLRLYLPVPATWQTYIAQGETPVVGAQRLCALGPGTRAFSEIAYASYLTWACPSLPVFMDTRFELYPSDMWEDHLVVIHGQFGWEGVLAKYGINAILAHKANQRMLVEAAKASPDWQTLYEDDFSILLRYTGPLTRR